MDRHGRIHRADGDGRRRPHGGFRVAGTARFRRIVADAVATLAPPVQRRVTGARLVVQDVPPPGDRVLLATFANGVLTIYRRPVEVRSDSRFTLEHVLAVAIDRAVATGQGSDDDL
ncbi:MAG TPA: hypothetical protein VM307_06135, partial [Egibacteraceae bacterium]|nr:hypothetical protein [Egibacteraceae bacterium]